MSPERTRRRVGLSRFIDLKATPTALRKFEKGREQFRPFVYDGRKEAVARLGSSDELPEHDSNSGEQYEASVVCEELVVSGCDAPELLHLLKKRSTRLRSL